MSSEEKDKVEGGEKIADDKPADLKPSTDDRKISKGKKTKKEKKDDPLRFQGGGVNFKAKIIGIESVPEARGDKMCQDAMAKLKQMVKAAGEHKQRIIVNVSLEGLKILDEKSGSILYHHAVHKISFISRDVSDARAFGYVYGHGDGKHDFFGIKTEKPSEGLVLTLRDLFQVVFEMKKREVEKMNEEKKKKEEEKDTDTKEEEKRAPLAEEEGAYDAAKTIESAEKKEDNLLDLESELGFLSENISRIDAFGPSADLQSPGTWGRQQSDPWGSAPQTPQTAGSGGSFPVTFNSPSQPQAPAWPQTSFPVAQNDPFDTTAVAPPLGQPQISVGFGGDPFVAPQPQQQQPLSFPAFGQAQQQQSFAAFPGVRSGESSPLPIGGISPVPQSSPAAKRQDTFGGVAVQPDPFGQDPFFSGGDKNDKYAGITEYQHSNPGSRRNSGQNETSNAFGMSAGGSTNSGSTTPDPFLSVTPLQPSPSPSPSPKPEKRDAFADLDTLGGSKPFIDKNDFFKQPPKPKLEQLSGGMANLAPPSKATDPFSPGLPPPTQAPPPNPMVAAPMGMGYAMPNGSMSPQPQMWQQAAMQAQQMPYMMAPQGMPPQQMAPPIPQRPQGGNPFLQSNQPGQVQWPQ